MERESRTILSPLDSTQHYYPKDRVPEIFMWVQCILPFFVIGLGTVVFGDSMAGFVLFYLVNCIGYTYYVVNYVPAFEPVWERVKNTNFWPTSDWTKLITGFILAALFCAGPALYGYFTRPGGHAFNPESKIKVSDVRTQEMQIGLTEIL